MYQRLEPYQPPEHQGLDLLYHDDNLLVINKPSGLLSVPGRGEYKQDSVASRVQAEYPEACIVHRLDMETSGVILMARDKETQRRLGRLFELRKVQKRYVALVDGRVEKLLGEIDLPLINDWPNRPRQIVDHEKGKPAKTRYRVLQRNIEEKITRLELEPETGRTHQLRVHLQALGHPILGDKLYAGEDAIMKSDRLLLHAQSLTLVHPFTEEPMRFLSVVPF